MTGAQIEIQLIAIAVAAACAIPGTFLVLRKMAMISDAISHSILPGIVIGFLVTQDLSSPLLVLMAALTGVLTVVLVEFVNKTKLVKEDTAIGLVFPALFSVGVILVARNAGDVHIDTHAVLVGEIAFAPFDRFMISGMDVGPKSLWVMGGILMLSLILLFMFFKELKVSTFDAELAASLGFSPAIIHYSLMSVTSITTVGAFDAIGAILVVALIVVPPAIAYLLTEDLKRMILLAVSFGIVSAIAGYWAAHWIDASIAGSMATMLGLIFLLVYLFAPGKGLISVLNRKRQQQKEFSLLTLMLHIKNHGREDVREREVDHLTGHFNWSRKHARSVLDLAMKNNMITIRHNLIELTERGRTFTAEALDYIVTNQKAEIEKIRGQFLMFRG